MQQVHHVQLHKETIETSLPKLAKVTSLSFPPSEWQNGEQDK